MVKSFFQFLEELCQTKWKDSSKVLDYPSGRIIADPNNDHHLSHHPSSVDIATLKLYYYIQKRHQFLHYISAVSIICKFSEDVSTTRRASI